MAEVESVPVRIQPGGQPVIPRQENFNIQNNKNSYNQIIKRLHDNPTSRDVYDGDALNAAD